MCECRPDRSHAFDCLAGDFWRAWGAYQGPFETDEDIDAKQDAACEAFFAVVRSRAPQVRHVAQKLRIAMTQADGTGDWVDRRFELMLASIVLDLETGGLD